MFLRRLPWPARLVTPAKIDLLICSLKLICIVFYLASSSHTHAVVTDTTECIVGTDVLCIYNTYLDCTNVPSRMNTQLGIHLDLSA